MKLTKTKLKQIIREELKKALKEYGTAEYEQYAAATPEVPGSEEVVASMTAKDEKREKCKQRWHEIVTQVLPLPGDPAHTSGGQWDELMANAKADPTCPDLAVKAVESGHRHQATSDMMYQGQ